MIAPLRMVTNVDDCQHDGPDLRDWIALDDAAERLGLNRDHLARECRAKLERVGRAKKARPEGGGAPKWFIARRHDLRLAPGSVGEAYQAPDLSAFTRRQVDDAYARVACVEAYRDARATWRGSQSNWMPRLVDQLRKRCPQIKISDRSLRRWYKDYQRPEDVVKLISNAGGNRRGQADPACWQAFKDLYLTERRHGVSWCWRMVDDFAKSKGLTWLTIDACRSQLDDRISPEEQAKYRNPRDYRNGFQPYAEWEPDAFKAGDNWLGDHCILDLFCLHGEGKSAKIIRPWITTWMDWRTRKIVGFHLSDGPNSYTILSALRRAVLDPSNHGGPGLVWIDNGKDYDSYVFHGQTKAERLKARQRLKNDRSIKRELGRLAKIEGGLRVDEDRTRFGVFNLLGIDAHFSLPYNPTGKSRMERWFGELHDKFDKLFQTYCGPTVVARPEDLAKRCKEHPHIVPRFDTVLKELRAFIDDYNNTTAMRLGAEGLSPNQAMAMLPHTVRKATTPEALRECLGMWSRPVSVGRNGVRICPGNVSYTYGRHEPALRALIRTGKKVHVRYDPEDMREVEVYDASGRHLCTASWNERINRDAVKHDDIKLLVNERKRRTKHREKLHRTAIRDILPVADAYAIEQAKKRNEAEQPIRVDPALVKSEPREVKLEPKPAKFDLAKHIQSIGGMPDITNLLKNKGKQNAKPEPPGDDFSIFDDPIECLPHESDNEDDIDIFGTLREQGGAA